MSTATGDWETCASPAEMFASVDPMSDRKRRLFFAACCRVVWDGIPAAAREAVAMGERWTDGNATDHERGAVEPRAVESHWETADDHNRAAHDLGCAEDVFPDTVTEDVLRKLRTHEARSRTALTGSAVALDVLSLDPGQLVRHYPDAITTVVGNGFEPPMIDPALTAALLREVFGNPFRPVELDPQWLTSDVLPLARGIYEERAFDRMPILADALQDAGCDIATVLDHCRDTSATHTRGCWVVDLLLGRE